MKTLPADLLTEIQKEYHSIAHLFKLEFTATYKWTDSDENIYYDSAWWYSRGINFDSASVASSPKIDTIDFQIDNVDLVISNIVMGEEVRGKPCTIWRVALDKNLTVLGVSKLFVGLIDAIEIDGKRARFSVFNHFVRWKMPTPRRIHQATCAWTFKGTECTYAGGGTWCDHSWERCDALSNTVNFGGFRWLPGLVDKQIWWGRAPTPVPWFMMR